MEKLLLTSYKLNWLKDLVGKDPSSLTLIFITTASNLYEEARKGFVEEDRKNLKKMGFKLKEIDIAGMQKVELKEQLSNCDVIYVAGGNTFYLLQEANKSGLGDIVKELVKKGKIYAGTSAGAVIAGPTIEPVKYLDPPEEAPELKSYNAFGLVDFVILPHYGLEKYEEQYKKTMKEFSNTGLNLITLTDDRAVIVEGKNHKVVEI